MTHFSFLASEWPELQAEACRAEELANPDPRTACFYARRALELMVRWLYRHDASLHPPYQDHLSALLYEPTFKALIGPGLLAKAKIIKDLGNLAVHSPKPVRPLDALVAVRELFHLGFWLARTYARKQRPAEGLIFQEALLPARSADHARTLSQLQALDSRLAEKDAQLAEALRAKAETDAQLAALQRAFAQAKAANEQIPSTHDYSEAETRRYLIDLLLKEAGWFLDEPKDQEFEVLGMPNTEGKGYVDYVLWGDDGKPLGLVEAKRTTKDPKVGRQQAKLYADCLEKAFGQRPVIFLSNGYQHWIWDDATYPPRPIQGFLKKPELDLAILRRSTRQSLKGAEISSAIVERPYQHRAIRHITEAFEGKERKALVVMATGAGKTRTVIALCDLLMRCNWAKRVLFLADRLALVNQAVGAFKTHLPASSPVNLISDRNQDGRVFVSTYQTMMGLIDQMNGGQRRFGPGHFDLVVIDEAHRSVYQKYGAIFEYFDSLLVGLTATPKDEIDKNTYSLFDLETGVPTDVYGLEEAVKDGFLVPPKPISVPLKFQREGITYDQLSDEEKAVWDSLDWEDGDVPDKVDPAALNQWLFNADTVDKVLEHLMTRGLKVAGGDRLGKTIVFAKNHDHAEFIAERFDAAFPHYAGHFARVIDFKVTYAQSLIDDFSETEKAPHIAISVDMLDTGIDVPDVVNLVFFKLVRSKTKFWQMVGRGTRLRKGLFGPGKDKAFFNLFDYCQNLEYFSQNPGRDPGSTAESLGKRLFRARVQLLVSLDQALSRRAGDGTPLPEWALRDQTAELLRSQIGAMNLESFLVRPHQEQVERWREASPWTHLNPLSAEDLVAHLGGLPTELKDEDEEAKRFDLIALRLQLAVLNQSDQFDGLRDQVKALAAALSEMANIPMVKAEMPLILDLASDTWWEGVTLPMLEQLRIKLRGLIKLIEKVRRVPIYTDFEDRMGVEQAIELPGVSTGTNMDKFRAKVRQFLLAHESHFAIHRLRMNEPLTAMDLLELERMITEAGLGHSAEIEQAKEECHGLGLFVRSLVGLDREAAKKAFIGFIDGRKFNSSQLEFIDFMINHLTDHGVMDPGLLYESPFTDYNPLGVEGVFDPNQVEMLVEILEEVRGRAVA